MGKAPKRQKPPPYHHPTYLEGKPDRECSMLEKAKVGKVSLPRLIVEMKICA